MNRRHEPRGVVQGALFNVAVRISGTAGNMIQASSAVRAEPAFHCFHGAGSPREHFRLPSRNMKMLLWYDRGHGECRPRLPLTFGAVASIHNRRRPGDFIADRAALAPAALGKDHAHAPIGAVLVPSAEGPI